MSEKKWAAFLIEDDGSTGSIRYRTMEQGMFTWTTDPLKALHFCRRMDADKFAEEDLQASAIHKHGFSD